jgi:hypothetical protein
VDPALVKEHARNLRWLRALQEAIRRGASDREAAAEANERVPEALQPPASGDRLEAALVPRLARSLAPAIEAITSRCSRSARARRPFPAGAR